MAETPTYQLVPPTVNTDLSPLATDLLTALRYSPHVHQGQVTEAGLLAAQTHVATASGHPGFRLVRAACAELVQRGCLVPAGEGRAMSVDIYESLHSRNDIRLSKISTALLLARHASPDGVVKMSYRYIAILLKCCKRTAIRHIKYLVEDAEILSKRPLTWIGRKQCDWNVYRFRIKFRRNSAHPYSSDKKAKMSQIPDNAMKERKEKAELHDVREEIRKQERTLRILDLTPGSPAYEAAHGEIARLKALVAEPSPPEERP